MKEKTTPPMEQITQHQQDERKLLESLAAQAGIAASYINAHGQQQAISTETKQRLLEAMHSIHADAGRLTGSTGGGVYSGAPLPSQSPDRWGIHVDADFRI